MTLTRPDTRAGYRFQIKPKTTEDGQEYVMWALIQSGQTHPCLVVASETETSAHREFEVWREAYEASNQNMRVATNLLWIFKHGKAPA